MIVPEIKTLGGLIDLPGFQINKNMIYEIFVNDYRLDENGIVLDRDGGELKFNDLDDFVMIWNYFKGSAPAKKIIDNGEYILMRPKKIEQFITDYLVTGESYKIIKEENGKNF